MKAEEKVTISETTDSEGTPPVTVSMKKLVVGIGTVFAGVIQMLEALEPQIAQQLVDMATQKTVTQEDPSSDAAVTEAQETENPERTGSEGVMEDAAAEPQGDDKTRQKAADSVQVPAHTVTVDDLTKIIVRKVKQDRSNNEKIGAILKTYGAAKVSELPAEKYEAFLTDISQL